MGETVLLGGLHAARRVAVGLAQREERASRPVQSAPRQKWTLTREAFDGLLAALDPDRDTAAERYLEVRRNLVRLFEWRGCATPGEYADEAINRCARKIGEGEPIRDVPTYCIGIARLLYREMQRDRDRAMVPLKEAPEPRTLPQEPATGCEQRLECLRRCLAQLSGENRELILHYYQGDKGDKINNRKGLLERLGIPASTLRMRALRVREKLQACAECCAQRREGASGVTNFAKLPVIYE